MCQIFDKVFICMKYNKLGKTKLKISQLGFGCWAIGSDKGNMVMAKLIKINPLNH